MKKHIKHIASLLLLFIAYSLLFQNLHILIHYHGHTHFQTDSDNHGIAQFCHSNNTCGHLHGNSSHTRNPDHPEQYGINEPDRLVNEDPDCPVCEFEFVKFDISKITTACFCPEILSFITSFLYQDPCILYNGNHISLRAPPSGNTP